MLVPVPPQAGAGRDLAASDAVSIPAACRSLSRLPSIRLRCRSRRVEPVQMQACFRARPALQGRKLPDEPAPLKSNRCRPFARWPYCSHLVRPSAGPHREEVPIAQAMAFAVVTRTRIRALPSGSAIHPNRATARWLVPPSNGAHLVIHSGPPCGGSLDPSRCGSPRPAQARRRLGSR